MKSNVNELLRYVSEDNYDEVYSIITTSPELINKRGELGQSALFMACLRGCEPIATLLIEHGADSNCRFDFLGNKFTAIEVGSVLYGNGFAKVLAQASMNHELSEANLDGRVIISKFSFNPHAENNKLEISYQKVSRSAFEKFMLFTALQKDHPNLIAGEVEFVTEESSSESDDMDFSKGSLG